MSSSLVFHIIIAFGAFQALFLASIIWFKKGKLTGILFSLFLLIEGLTLIERLMAETDLMVNFPHLLGISYPLNFIKSPILFFLAISIIKPEFKIRIKHLTHSIPFFLMLLMNVPFYMMSGAEKIEQVQAFINYVPEYSSFNFWFFLSFFAYIGIYLGLSIKELRNYRLHIKSNKLANWYLWVIVFYSALLGIQLIHFIFRPSGLVEFPFINEASMLLMTFLIQSIAYSFLSQTPVFDQRNDKFLNNLDSLSTDSALVREQLEKEKAYLDDNVTLDEFATSLGFSKKHVSEIVNQSFGITFKELINRYRIEEAKRIMKDEINSDPKINQIGMRSGFNNKVSFYRTFKKHTGKSPSEYLNGLSK